MPLVVAVVWGHMIWSWMKRRRIYRRLEEALPTGVAHFAQLLELGKHGRAAVRQGRRAPDIDRAVLPAASDHRPARDPASDEGHLADQSRRAKHPRATRPAGRRSVWRSLTRTSECFGSANDVGGGPHHRDDAQGGGRQAAVPRGLPGTLGRRTPHDTHRTHPRRAPASGRRAVAHGGLPEKQVPEPARRGDDVPQDRGAGTRRVGGEAAAGGRRRGAG